MPEYLSPGVYVEEVDSGPKPIEGVSTSTTGMFGVTERGPVGVPILVTGFGEYLRWFGGHLNPDDFQHNGRQHCYLSHAVDGFFRNGGRRLWLVRVLDTDAAANARFMLHDAGDVGSVETRLLRSTRELTGTVANPPSIYLLDTTGIAAGDRVRIGSGSDAEYLDIDGPGTTTNHIALNYPLSRSYDVGSNVQKDTIVSAATGSPVLDTDADVGDVTIEVDPDSDAASFVDGALLQIGTDDLTAEHRFIIGTPVTVGGMLRVTLNSGLMRPYDAASGVPVVPLTLAGVAPDTLDFQATAGASTVFATGGVPARDSLLIFEDPAGTNQEARRVGEINRLDLLTGAYESYPAGSIVEPLTLTDSGAATLKSLTADVSAGTAVIALDDRVNLDPGDILRVGAAPDDEYVTIADGGVPDPSPGGAAPNAGIVILTHPLGRDHASGDPVALQDVAPTASTPVASLPVEVEAESDTLAVTDGGASLAPASDFKGGGHIRVRLTSGELYYHVLAADASSLTPGPMDLTVPVSRNHSLGSEVAQREPLLLVQAIDAGAWGRRLRVSVEIQDDGLVSGSTVDAVVGPTTIRPSSLTGMEPGTILELLSHETDEQVGDRLKVNSVDRNQGTVELASALSSAQTTAINDAVLDGEQAGLRSVEFQLSVYLLQQPSPAVPSRDNSVIDSEVFRDLSLDPRHSRFVETVIGATDGEPRLSDRRPGGRSWYVRVKDEADGDAATQETIRIGPEALVDVLPSGRTSPARHALTGGDDSIATLTDNLYIGQNGAQPEDRTGLHSLQNLEDISLVSCPGQTTPTIQQAIITHCESMRYRFAVLDGPPPPDDTLVDVRAQRQQFDTRYAGLYYPWLVIPETHPDSLDEIQDFPIPPSGHVLGVIARTDIERGVHKAPANETVRGILHLQRAINQREHDLLNTNNINVIRDFRRNNRGLRIWGARCITADPDMRYVNVRRLLIFVERSIELGLQWVVFEPNAEPLWARVRRAIINFLTVVWRNGALEGLSQDEAFFVKCDLTTMTQQDIDNGRLICLVGLAPVKPAEFVIIRIGLKTRQAQD